jgi:hypothetical protein
MTESSVLKEHKKLYKQILQQYKEQGNKLTEAERRNNSQQVSTAPNLCC